MEYGKTFEKERSHRYELPIAQSTAIYVNSQKTQPPYSSPLDFCFFGSGDEGKIRSDVCDCFLNLSRDGLLPSWVLEVAPVEEIRKNTKGEKVTSVRAWMTKGLLLLLPTMSLSAVKVGMVLSNGEHTTGKTTLWDIDSKRSHDLIIPKNLEPVSTDTQLLLFKPLRLKSV